MEFTVDTEEVIQSMMDDDNMMDSLVEKLTERMVSNISESTREEVREAFDYHHDHFRMSWARMMESEINDLTSSTRESACGHGQQMYDGIFHAIREFVSGEGRTWMKDSLGIDGLAQTITELVEAAVETTVQARLKNVTTYGLTVDARPIMAKIGEPQPAFTSFSDGDWVICNAANEPHLWAPSCTNARRAEDEFGNPLVSTISDE